MLAAALAPAERGLAFGYNSMGRNVGVILGILLGGVRITFASWRWSFWINVPTGLVALAVAVVVLRDVHPVQRQRLDLVGMVALGAGRFGVLWAMTKLATESLSAAVLGSLSEAWWRWSPS